MSGAPPAHPRTHYVPRADAPGEYYAYPEDYAGDRDEYDGEHRGARRNKYMDGGAEGSPVHERSQYEEPGPGQRAYKPKTTSKESWWR